MKYDIAIIGASTSGLYAAELLALAGRRVGVFERRSNLAAARRTLIVTPAFSRVLDVPDESILHRLTYLDLQAGQQEARVELQDPDLIVERSYLMRHLADRAERAGAEINFGMSLKSITGTDVGAELVLGVEGADEQRVVADNVIGADGAASTVARCSGLRLAPRVPLMQAEVKLPDGWDPMVTKAGSTTPLDSSTGLSPNPTVTVWSDWRRAMGTKSDQYLRPRLNVWTWKHLTISLHKSLYSIPNSSGKHS